MSGFEPPASPPQTVHSDQTELHPDKSIYVNAEITRCNECLQTVPFPVLTVKLIFHPLGELPSFLVPLNAAFFEVWLFTCRIVLVIVRSSICLASSSSPLRDYVFTPNKSLWLAASATPDYPKALVLGTFRTIPGQTLRFWNATWELNPRTTVLKTVALPTELIAYNPLRCAVPVASHLVRNEIQHTYCFSACEPTKPFFKTPYIQLRYGIPAPFEMPIAFPCGSDRLLAIRYRSRYIGLDVTEKFHLLTWSPIWLSMLSHQSVTLHFRFAPFPGTHLSAQSDLYRWTISSGSLRETYLWDRCRSYPNDAIPPS